MSFAIVPLICLTTEDVTNIEGAAAVTNNWRWSRLRLGSDAMLLSHIDIKRAQESRLAVFNDHIPLGKTTLATDQQVGEEPHALVLRRGEFGNADEGSQRRRPENYFCERNRWGKERTGRIA